MARRVGLDQRDERDPRRRLRRHGRVPRRQDAELRGYADTWSKGRRETSELRSLYAREQRAAPPAKRQPRQGRVPEHRLPELRTRSTPSSAGPGSWTTASSTRPASGAPWPPSSATPAPRARSSDDPDSTSRASSPASSGEYRARGPDPVVEPPSTPRPCRRRQGDPRRARLDPRPPAPRGTRSAFSRSSGPALQRRQVHPRQGRMRSPWSGGTRRSRSAQRRRHRHPVRLLGHVFDRSAGGQQLHPRLRRPGPGTRHRAPPGRAHAVRSTDRSDGDGQGSSFTVRMPVPA